MSGSDASSDRKSGEFLDYPRASPSIVTDRFARVGMAFLVAYAAYRSLVNAASKPLWLDEICTAILVRQPNARALWSALASGADSHPPPYYLIERAASAISQNEHLALRLPSIVGFCIVLICIFILIKRRSGNAWALVCASVPLMTILFDTYAVEARGYSLVCAFVAIALVCYQRAASMAWVVCMGLSLACAEAIHYYAALAFVPFAFAEIALSVKERSFRLRVWVALFGAILPLIAFLPLLLHLKQYYGPHFWSVPSLLNSASTYGWFLYLPVALGLALVTTLAVGVIEELAFRSGPKTPSHEFVLLLGFLALPIIAFLAAKLAHGGLINRYVLPSILGIPLAVGYASTRLGRRSGALIACLIFSSLAARESWFWITHIRGGHLWQPISPALAVETLAVSAGHASLPIVLGSNYLQIEHYATPEWKQRFVAVVDIPASIAFGGSDSLDKLMLVLASIHPIQVQQFQDFAARHPEFLLYDGKGLGRDWWTNRLIHDGYSLRLVSANDDDRIYLVSFPEKRVKDATLSSN
jgi:hypothetical protein